MSFAHPCPFRDRMFIVLSDYCSGMKVPAGRNVLCKIFLKGTVLANTYKHFISNETGLENIRLKMTIPGDVLNYQRRIDLIDITEKYGNLKIC